MANKERIDAYQAAYRDANRDKSKAYAARYYQDNKAKFDDYAKKSNLKRKYGLSVDEYNAMVEEQQNRCAICQTEGVKLAVDHCHETGRVRGLLCRGCNSGIGQLGDDMPRVFRAYDYLRRSVVSVGDE